MRLKSTDSFHTGGMKHYNRSHSVQSIPIPNVQLVVLRASFLFL